MTRTLASGVGFTWTTKTQGTHDRKGKERGSFERRNFLNFKFRWKGLNIFCLTKNQMPRKVGRLGRKIPKARKDLPDMYNINLKRDDRRNRRRPEIIYCTHSFPAYE